MILTGYRPADCRELAELFYDTVHTINAGDYTEEQLEKMADQARELMDEELREANPKDVYLESVKNDISSYSKEKKKIYSISMDGSNEVLYKTIQGRECAYVDVTYSMKGKDSPGRSSQTYILRKDEDSRWKILGFYQ